MTDPLDPARIDALIYRISVCSTVDNVDRQTVIAMRDAIEALRAEVLVARVQGMREIEDMHQRAWARESEAGNHDEAHWHRRVAEHIAAMIDALEKGRGQ